MYIHFYCRFFKSRKELALEKALSKMSNLDHMLEVMYEFIQTYVQSCQVEDKNQP